MATAQAMPAAASGAYASMDPEARPLWPAGAEAASAYGAKFSITKKRDRTWNLCSLCVAIALPWSIFALVFAVVSFPIGVDGSSLIGTAQICFVICCACLLIVIALGYAAALSWMKAQELTWYTLIFVTALIGWVVGMGLGQVNYTRNMETWAKLTDAATYKAVDPGAVSGVAVADAGRVFFEAGSHVDTRLAMAYKDTYCIAPYVNENVPASSPRRYDFWTVDRDCCIQTAMDDVAWFCNHKHLPTNEERMKDMHIFSGVRWLKDEGGFRHALEEAEARYNISVTDPIFLEGTEDADAVVASYQNHGIQLYCEGLIVFLAFQVVLVASGAVVLTLRKW